MSGVAAMNTPQEATSEDPAASLRAAALRTLKSKRRKLNSAQAPDIPSTLPTRPIVVPTPSIQLDYGQAEPAEASPVPPSATTSLTKEDVSRMDVDEDSLAREEGEISDSETAPETPSKRNTTSAMEVTQPSRLPPPTLTPPTSISVKTESLPVIIPEVHSAAVRPTPERFLAFDPDMGYVRPGLQMTQANYDTAKDIILDLLGWGVPPEYLVRCGLSREIVYYAFLDFNLRLPADFDVTGLPTVDELAAMASAVLGRRTTSRSATPIRPHPTSPPPSSADVTTQPTSLSAIAPPFVPPATANGTDTNLSELEQQRRNMLLARKAAQKSRKPKEPLAHEAPRPLQVPAGIIPQHNGVHSLSSVPPMAVDDFLNSIEPTRDNSREGSKAPVSRTNTADDMDVDEPSGLITRSFSVPDSGEGSSAASPGPSKLTEQTPTPLQRSDTDKIFASGAGSRSSSSSATPPIAVPKVPTLPVRRGTKRPVAADFVDMEPVSSRSTNGQSTLQHHHHHHGASRKKPGGFAVVSSKPRRMVIDLTDSEDDSGDDDDVSRPRQRGGSVQAKATVLSTAPSELEREILNLKAQIARRELEAKLKKQRDIALASGSGTPLASEEPPIVKQEEDDEMTVSVALQGVDDRTTTEPPDSGAPSLPESTAHSPPMTPDTPIDIAHSTMEHPATGDKVLTDEARQEQVVAPPSSSTHTASKGQADVGVISSIAKMSSTQAPTDHERLSNGENTQAEARRGFFTYQSPLTRFPLLHSHSQRPFSGYAWQRSDTATTSDSTFGFYISNTFIDLRPLKVAATVKWFSDPSIRICQYEVPGGGECRDSNCSDLHLSQMSNTEPDDEETAQYLSSAVPQCAEMDAGKIRKALEETRQRRTANGNLEHRIAEALASLGVR